MPPDPTPARTVDLDRERQLRRDDSIDFSLPPIMEAREHLIAAACAWVDPIEDGSDFYQPGSVQHARYTELRDAVAAYEALIAKERTDG